MAISSAFSISGNENYCLEYLLQQSQQNSELNFLTQMVTKQHLNSIDANNLQNAHQPIIIMIKSTLPAAFVLHQGNIDERKCKTLFD